MTETKYIKNTIKTKLNDLSKKVVLVKDMKDEDIIKMGSALANTVKDMKRETKEIEDGLNKLLTILSAEKDKRGIARLHENQLSIFDTLPKALEKKEEE